MANIFRNVLKKTQGVRDCMPMKENRFVHEGKALVSIEKSSKSIDERVRAAVDAIGGFGRIIKKGDSVLLKPNFVFPAPPPCTTSIDFLQAVIRHCFKAGASWGGLGGKGADYRGSKIKRHSGMTG